MSPSEFDLRAALRDGEGDSVDPDKAIAAGRARIAQRRTHLRNGAATAVLVAALVGGGISLFSGGSDHETAGNGGQNLDRRNTDTKGGAGGVAGGATTPRPSTTAPAPRAAAVPSLTCAATAPAAPAALPARTADATTPMFAKPVGEIVICAYPTATSTESPRAAVLTGDQAAEFAASLENASPTPPTGACPHYISADERRLAVTAFTADAKPLPVVVTTLNATPCRVVVSNGSAVRYAWTPPADLGPALRQLVGAESIVPNQGSPARS